MKKNISLILLLFIGIASSYAQSKETRDVRAFTKIAFRVPGKLYLRQGSTQKVEIEASKEMLSYIETEVEGSRLVIHTPRKWNWKNDEKIAIYITVKDLEGVSVAGSGDLIGEGKFNARDLELNVSGSGSLKMDVEVAEELETSVSGSGQLNVKGTCNRFTSQVSGSGRVTTDMSVKGKAEFGVSGSGRIEANGRSEEVKTTISGSGRVLAANFEAKRCEVRISGSGSVEINVKEELDASISGSGSVSYKGNPSKVNSHSSGSGKVHKM